MSAAAKKKPRPDKPVYFVVARACDVPPNTGVLVPMTKWDQRTMRERQYHVGTQLRGSMKKPRNVKFNRLAHAMGALMVDQHEDFAGMATHDALKRLQAESGAACEIVEYDIPGVGKLTRTEPQSLAFDSMDEGQFQEVMRTIYRHISAKYWTTLDELAIEQMVEMYDTRGEA